MVLSILKEITITLKSVTLFSIIFTLKINIFKSFFGIE